MDAVAEASLLAQGPATRQVLANVGNRYVVFGSQNGLPRHPIMAPNDVRRPFLDRVHDEYDFPRERLIRSIQVEDAEVRPAGALDREWDIEVFYSNGAKLLVDVKIRTRDSYSREFVTNVAWLKAIKHLGLGQPEIWIFNIERLRLNIMALDDHDLPFICELHPLNIWEFNGNGSTLQRPDVVRRVEDWVKRINALYDNVEDWSAPLGLRTDRSRMVRMSEDLMQKFAVPDQDLSILDLDKDDTPLLSFVPIGRWIFGSNGMIDIISKHKTIPLLDTADEPHPPHWVILSDRDKMQFKPWCKDNFLDIVALAAG